MDEGTRRGIRLASLMVAGGCLLLSGALTLTRGLIEDGTLATAIGGLSLAAALAILVGTLRERSRS